MEIMIKKRDGHFEPLSVEKTKRMIAFACLGFDSCDPLELEMDAKLQFVDGMTTKEIQKTSVEDVRGPNIQVGSLSEITVNGNWPTSYDAKIAKQ